MTEWNRRLNYGKDETLRDNSDFQGFFEEFCYKGGTFHTLTYNKVTLFRCSSCLSFCIFVVLLHRLRYFKNIVVRCIKFITCVHKGQRVWSSSRRRRISYPFHLIKYGFFRVLTGILSRTHICLTDDFPSHYEMA